MFSDITASYFDMLSSCSDMPRIIKAPRPKLTEEQLIALMVSYLRAKYKITMQTKQYLFRWGAGTLNRYNLPILDGLCKRSLQSQESEIRPILSKTQLARRHSDDLR